MLPTLVNLFLIFIASSLSLQTARCSKSRSQPKEAGQNWLAAVCLGNGATELIFWTQNRESTSANCARVADERRIVEQIATSLGLAKSRRSEPTCDHCPCESTCESVRAKCLCRDTRVKHYLLTFPNYRLFGYSSI